LRCPQVIRADATVQSAETPKLQKYLHRFNLLTGLMLLLWTGLFGVITSVLSLSIVGVLMCTYCAGFGMAMIAFEMSSSARVVKYFRVNYGFAMTYRGRCAARLSLCLRAAFSL
jgi:hypothetical protein